LQAELLKIGQNMEYHITKIKVKDNSFGTPVSTSLDEIVERMLSDKNAQAVEDIAKFVTYSLIQKQDKGRESYGIKGMSDLPYLIFSATFGRQGLQEFRQPTGLVLLSVDYGLDVQRMQAIRDLAVQLPQTVLVFRSVSRRSLKIVVHCKPKEGNLPQTAEDYERFLGEAQQQAALYYGAFCDCQIGLKAESLQRGCRMSQDPQLYYNRDAEPLTIIHKDNSPLKAYPHAHTDRQGWTDSNATSEQQEKERADFYACQRKAVEDYMPESDDEAIQEDGRMTLLAQYCRKSGLPEESSVIRAARYANQLAIENIRSIFRSIYAENEPGRPMAMMTEKQRIARKVREFFDRRYDLRYNELKHIEEFRPKGHDYWPWLPLTDRDLRRIAHEEMIDAGAAWSIDIEMYVRSSLIKSYNPIHEFLAGCGKWDGKRDYIGELARRVPNQYADWERFFHRWFLGMVAQWLGKSRDFGNAVVPMLIGPQATHKSTFCKLIIPMGLREYYIDDIKMDNAEQVERMLGRMALVNIDEYNAKTDREQAKIKRILTEKDVQVRRMRSDQYMMTQRMASFIATTNERQPLNDPTGSRRYLCVEVTGIIDTDTRINYQQLYAQAVEELNQKQPYYFTKAEEAAIEAHNRLYQNMSTTEILLATYYEPAERNKAYFLRATDILTDLQSHTSGIDKPNMKQLTIALKSAGYQYGAQDGIRGWYAKKRSEK
jgi:predicted P-loop ATPase